MTTFWDTLPGPSRRSTHGRGHRWIAPDGYATLLEHVLRELGLEPRYEFWPKIALCANRSGGRFRFCLKREGDVWGKSLAQTFDTRQERDEFLRERGEFPDHGLSYP